MFHHYSKNLRINKKKRSCIKLKLYLRQIRQKIRINKSLRQLTTKGIISSILAMEKHKKGKLLIEDKNIDIENY